MVKGVKPYVLKLTARELIFVDDGLTALIRHLKEIGLLKDKIQGEIDVIFKKISDEMKND